MKRTTDRFCAILLVAFCLAGSLINCLAAGSLEDKPKEAIREVVGYLPMARMDDMLLLPFDIPWPENGDHKQWPAIAKFTYAYLAYEETRAGAGNDFLAAAIYDLSKRNAAAESEPAFKPSFARLRADEGLKLGLDPPERPKMLKSEEILKLPVAVKEAIIQISHYCAGTFLGSDYNIFVHRLGLTPETALRILAEPRSREQAYLHAFQSMDSKTQVESKLKALVSAVRSENIAIDYEPALSDYLGPQYRSPGDFGSGGPFPGSASPSRPPPRGPVPRDPSPSSAFARYEKVERENIRSGRSFRQMRATPRGFGGILFGNSVTSSLPKVHTIGFERLPDKDYGDFVITLKDQRTLRLQGVANEDAYAAYRILYSPMATNRVPKPGEGIGLVGVLNNLPFVERGSNRVVTGSEYQVVLHPALIDTELGWCLLDVDVAPIHQGQLLQLTNRDIGSGLQNCFGQLWQTLDKEGNLGTWKVVDVPMRIEEGRNSSGRTSLLVSRSPAQGEKFPEGLARVAFIEMAPYRSSASVLFDALGSDKKVTSGLDGASSEGDRIDREFAAAFYRSLPTLLRYSYDYQRVNGFARVLAVARWARENGAEFDKKRVPQPPGEVPTPRAIKLYENRLEAIADYAVADKERQRLLEETEKLANELQATNRAVREFASKSEKLEADRSALLRDFLAADAGSEAEREAKLKVDSLLNREDELRRDARNTAEISDYLVVTRVKSALKELGGADDNNQ